MGPLKLVCEYPPEVDKLSELISISDTSRVLELGGFNGERKSWVKFEEGGFDSGA